MLAIGDRIEGRYRVERLIGEGGMGAVYAVSDDQGGHLAMKVLLDTSDETLAKRFAREAHTTAKLTSRHVPRMYGAGALADGTPYLLMELLHGEDLADVLHRQGPLSAQEAVDYLVEVSDAIAEAHRLGMVHRDIKPANVFVATLADGTRCVKLLDFGISKPALNTIAPMTLLTQTGTFLGSPDYMAPEQILSSSDVDARADIWALGVTLQELLTATQPFHADTLAELISTIMRDPPLSLRELRPDLPDALVTVVERCLQKDAELRYATIEELVAALRAAVPPATAARITVQPSVPSYPGPVSGSSPTIASGHEVVTPSAAPLSAGVTSIKPEPPRRRAWPFALLAVAGLILGVGGTLLWAESRTEPRSSRRSIAEDDDALPKAVRQRVNSDIAKAEDHLDAGELDAALGAASDALDALEQADVDRGLHGARAADVRTRVSIARAQRDLRRVTPSDYDVMTTAQHIGAAVTQSYKAAAWDPKASFCPKIRGVEAHAMAVEELLEVTASWPSSVRAPMMYTIEVWADAGLNHARALLGDTTVPKKCKRRVNKMKRRLTSGKERVEDARSKLR